MSTSFPLLSRIAAWFGGVRRRALLLGSLIPAVVLAGAGSAPAASTTPLPRIDLKVLLLGTSSTEPDFQAWQAALQREGVKFDTLVGPTHAPITASTLSATLPDGTPEAKYDAVIESVGGLTDCSTGTCVSDLSSAETTALEQYEHKFNIRQVTGDVYPGTTFGMNLPAFSGALDATSGTLTTAGQQVFTYLKPTAPITMDTGTYGYEATPISTTNFDTLVGGPNGSALVGIYTHPDGVQEMVETFAQNQYQLQSELLRHGAITWATRGVYFGDQRNYLETHIDDNFLSDDSWSTATHSTDFNPANALREVPADVTQAAQWSAANHFRIDMLFNGAGSVAVANGSSLVGAGDSGSGTTGSSGGAGGSGTCSTANPCPDPLLTAFQSPDPTNGNKPYTQDFGWINHTWDHPNIDEGCATQNYIEAELNQNTSWGAAAAKSGNPISGGLGLTSSTDPTAALGTENPNVVVTGEHSGLANLIPGNPGQVDPPSLSSATAGAGGSLAAGTYEYAISDQFNTAAPNATGVAAAGESAASISAPLTVAASGSVSLSWTAVCHAAEYKIYRAPVTGTTVGAWTLIGTVAATPATDFVNPVSTTDTANGGPIEKSFTDNGATGTTATPPSTSSANESAYEQNPALDAAFKGTLDGGIKYFGADASKPYPNPADGSFATGAAPSSQYTAGSTFTDAGGTAIPRYPTNIYYNVSTNAQEVDEYQTLYDLPTCKPVTGVTTCNPAGTPFTIDTIVKSIDQGMFQHMMGNDPRPHYFHQTNLMAQHTGSVNGQGDGLFYETMNPLLAEYSQYFAANAPIEQLTMAQIGALLSQQAAWAANNTVTGYIQGNQVTITNTGAAVQAPLSGITTAGSAYGGTQSGWASVPAGTSTYTATITWPADVLAVSLSPASIVANGSSTSTATVTVTADGKPVAGDAAALTFTSDDTGVKFGTVTDNNNGTGTYTVPVTGSSTVHPVTITATDTAVAPVATGQATLNQTAGQVSGVTVSVSPGSIVADGTSTATATARLTDTQGHPVPGENVRFTSDDPGVRFGTVTGQDGTYTATITSSTTAHVVKITATDSSVTPSPSGATTLTQTQKPSAPTPPSNPAPPANPAPPSAPANPSSPASSGLPTQAQLKSVLAGLLVPSGKNGRIPSLLKHGGYSRSVRMAMVTHLTVNWRQPAAKGRKGMLIAKLDVTIASGRVVTIKIALTKQGRRLLAHSKRLRVAADGTLSIAGVSPVNAAASFLANTTGR
ncbi:MAG: Ig-like domain-containing protein [Solirubrobacterales bacterium]|nr:Ig-like domain-containing protein [Solirubrobacterales bacterium]